MLKISNLISACISFLIFATPIYAQDVLGTAVVNGRSIEILENQTWRYKLDAPPYLSNCDALELGMYFCNEYNWKVTEAAGAASRMYMIDDRTYAMFIIENIGRADGLTAETMSAIVIGYAAEGGNTTPDQILQHFSEEAEANGHAFTSLSYSTAVKGLEATFINNIYLQEKVTVQAILYTIGTSVTDVLLKQNQALVSNIYFTD